MKNQTGRILFAIFLIGLGVLGLLGNLRILPIDFNNETLIWLLLFGVVGLGFMAAFLSNIHEMWWAAIPGMTLIGLAMLIGLPAFWGPAGGAVFLGMIGLSFLIIYLLRREFWWAIIPGGVLGTLALVSLIAEAGNGYLGGGVFFLGLALTFLIVSLVPTAEGRMRWAYWPAGILGMMGALILIGAGGAAAYVWPIMLIGFGGFLVLRAMQRKSE